MDSTRVPIRLSYCCVVALLALLLIPATGSAQVRTKKPDRGVYQPPILQRPSNDSGSQRDFAELVRSRAPARSQSPRRIEQRPDDNIHRVDPDDDDIGPAQPRGGPLVDVELVDANHTSQGDGNTTNHRDVRTSLVERQPKLKRVGHEGVILSEPHRETVIGEEVIVDGGEVWIEQPGEWTEHNDTIGCDSGCSSGCDSPCGNATWRSGVPVWMQDWSNANICFGPDRWFGSAEILLMFRRGDRPPTLVTTGSDADPDTAGQLDQATTQILLGGDSILKDVTAGGRFTLGTWLDNQECRSLTLRGWFAGEKTFGFHLNQDQQPVITRPFLNVSDDEAAGGVPDALLIAFPDRASGSVSVIADSEIFGGDVAVREFWYGKYGGIVEFLYGYQYMRLNEDLRISSTSTSLNNDFAPVGSVISIADSFDTENEFHGGQIGLVSRYREGCWSFNGLFKVGFGSLRRQATLNGSTLTSIDGANALDPNGLLVRSTNRGTTTDHTFGWVPEIDLSLGWQRYPCFDVTIGYHVIGMTDAIQPSGAIDPNLAVNLSDPPTRDQNPVVALRYDTYYVQGIHFGMQYIY